MTTASPQPATRERKRRISPELRSRLEADVAEIRTELSRLATKDDIEEVKRLINARTADILEAIEWRAAKSPSA